MQKIKISKCTEILNSDSIESEFLLEWDNVTKELIVGFVNNHNSSLKEKIHTTYSFLEEGTWEIIGYIMISIGEFTSAKTEHKTFTEQKKLQHRRYPVLWLDFIIRKPWDKYKEYWQIMFDALEEIVCSIESYVDIKYIRAEVIKKRISYFKERWFVSCRHPKIQLRSENDTLDMLLEI